MPLTCPTATASAIYDARTLAALSLLLGQAQLSSPGDPFAAQVVWWLPSLNAWASWPPVALDAGSDGQSSLCSSIVARDEALVRLRDLHLDAMRASECEACTFAVLYYPEAIGLIRKETALTFDTWDRGAIRRAVRLVCKVAGSDLEAIDRHDAFRALTRDLGTYVRKTDPHLANVLRFPTIAALRPRKYSAPVSKSARGPASGDLLGQA